MLLDHLNMSKVIYILVLTRHWVMDFHFGLEKAAASNIIGESLGMDVMERRERRWRSLNAA